MKKIALLLAACAALTMASCDKKANEASGSTNVEQSAEMTSVKIYPLTSVSGTNFKSFKINCDTFEVKRVGEKGENYEVEIEVPIRCEENIEATEITTMPTLIIKDNADEPILKTTLADDQKTAVLELMKTAKPEDTKSFLFKGEVKKADWERFNGERISLSISAPM